MGRHRYKDKKITIDNFQKIRNRSAVPDLFIVIKIKIFLFLFRDAQIAWLVKMPL